MDVNISEEMVLEELKKIDPYKSNTEDCIHPRIVKEVMLTIAAPLTLLYNMSLTTGVVPARWKLNKILFFQ